MMVTQIIMMVAHRLVKFKLAVKIAVVMDTVSLWLMDHVRLLVEMDFWPVLNNVMMEIVFQMMVARLHV